MVSVKLEFVNKRSTARPEIQLAGLNAFPCFGPQTGAQTNLNALFCPLSVLLIIGAIRITVGQSGGAKRALLGRFDWMIRPINHIHLLLAQLDRRQLSGLLSILSWESHHFCQRASERANEQARSKPKRRQAGERSKR